MSKNNLFELIAVIFFGVSIVTAMVSVHFDLSPIIARLSILISMWCFLSMSWLGRKRIQGQESNKATGVLKKTLGVYSYFFFYTWFIVTMVFTFNLVFNR
jgi:uncharacterized membrane protein YcaP (DUF421 family)